jgi:polyisoprenoid-binding protein YceI
MRARNILGTAAILLALNLLTGFSSQSWAADTEKVDKVHSAVLFRVKHMNVGYIYGRFNDISGTFTLDAKNPDKSSFDVQVKVDSLDSGAEARDKHLKTPQFFNAKEFPTIRFKSKKVKALANKRYRVTGDLTLHGVTKSVTVKLEHVGSAKDFQGVNRTGVETTFTIKRSDFGMKEMLQAIGDEIRITVALEGTHK